MVICLTGLVPGCVCVCVYLSSFMSPADPDDALGDGSNHMASGSWKRGTSEPHNCPRSASSTF